MADIEKNVNNENEEELTSVFTLTDEETGEETDFELIAQATIDEQLYFALTPVTEGDDAEEYVILKVTEDGEDLLLETIEDDEEFEKAEDYFNDLLFNEINYDN